MAAPKRIIVSRLHRYSNSIGGELKLDGQHVCYTLELPWRWNQKDVSCVPAGIYSCWWRYDRFRIQLENIPCPGGFRVGVEIHTGNRPKQVQGCILVGTSISANYAHQSKDAMARLTSALFPGEYGPGYSGGPMTLGIGGVMMTGVFDNIDRYKPHQFAGQV
jgi:hypothetical protein